MQFRVLALAAAMAAAPLAAYAAPAPGTVEIRIKGVLNANGNLSVSLCKSDEFLKKRCSFVTRAQPKKGTVVVNLTGVPPGAYAALVYHDENGDGKMDVNAMGIPKEGFAFSRGAKGRRGPPKFSDAAVNVGASGKVDIQLAY